MATIPDLESQIRAELANIGIPAVSGGLRTEQLVTRGSAVSALTFPVVGYIHTVSNVQREIVTVQIEVVNRASGATPAQMETILDAARPDMETITRPEWWTQFAAVDRVDDGEGGIEVSAEPERVGEVVTFTVRATIALAI